jgi:hypothetical protein
MIAPDIISEGRFLRMSLTAQALYMHLLANADDDGCVDAYTITRLIGAKEDDLVLLKEREYIVVLDEKEWILWISGWQDFNWIDARYKEDSKYLPLLRAKVEGLVIVESTKTEYNKRRYASRKFEKTTLPEPSDDSAHGHPMGSPGEYTAGTPLRKGKIRKDKDNTTSPAVAEAPVERRTNETYLYWEAQICPITTTQDTQRRACITLQNKYGLEACQKMIRVVAAAHADQYARKEYKCLSPTALLANWDKVLIYAKAKYAQTAASTPI